MVIRAENVLNKKTETLQKKNLKLQQAFLSFRGGCDHNQKEYYTGTLSCGHYLQNNQSLNESHQYSIREENSTISKRETHPELICVTNVFSASVKCAQSVNI